MKNRSVQVLILLGIYLGLAPFLPKIVHQSLYAVSLMIKDVLLWILPITVSFFIAHAISSFEKRAPIFILVLFLFEGISNFISVWYSFGCGQVAARFLTEMAPYHFIDAFTPLWRLPLAKPVWWSADKGSFLGIALGLLAAFRSPFLREFLARGKRTAEWILTRIFSRLIPLFILGFVARMYNLQLLNQMAAHYADFILFLILFLLVYIAVLFGIGSRFSLRIFLENVKNLLPAAGMSFSSGCSLSTMPLTISGTAKNLQNPELAKAVIPATTNIQQIGDCIANAFLCFLIYLYFNGHPPPLSVWIPFSAVFMLARFATAAVLGGAIFVMLPIYESYLGFTPEMVAIILAFNVVLDPVITCSNVVSNGALCRIFERVWNSLFERVSVEGERIQQSSGTYKDRYLQ